MSGIRRAYADPSRVRRVASGNQFQKFGNPLQINTQTVDHILDTAVAAAADGSSGLHAALDELPAALYVTDPNGTITFYNEACIDLAGRTPAVGVDKWCVTWKLYTPDGEPLPHDQCPMAVALREKRPVRGASAIAERPDGTRIAFHPYPTPLFDDEGNLAGAVNLLVEAPASTNAEHFRAQASKCRSLAGNLEDGEAAETLSLMAAKYDEHALKLGRRN